jgi:hypothetical protein
MSDEAKRDGLLALGDAPRGSPQNADYGIRSIGVMCSSARR